MKIEAVLFDSGDTLVFPKGGSWWPGPDFASVLMHHRLDPRDFDAETMRTALHRAELVFEERRFVLDDAEERVLFGKYYRALCDSLGISGHATLIDDLAKAYVDGCNIELYPDTIGVLRELTRRSVVLGLLSDAWPSLERKYLFLGIRSYFQSFTLSCRVGCYKPAPAMYLKASEEMRMEPGSILFVDDDQDNVRAAVRLGMQGIVILRNRKPDPSGMTTIPDLGSILPLIA
jgi:putative hydrolase of the HAD superfamily